MKSKTEILKEFSLFSMPTGGIGSWLTEQTHSDVFERLGRISVRGISKVADVVADNVIEAHRGSWPLGRSRARISSS